MVIHENYIKICTFPLASCVVRDASGNMTDILTGNLTDGCVGLGCKMGWNFTDCTQQKNCEYGLANNSKVLVHSVSHFVIGKKDTKPNKSTFLVKSLTLCQYSCYIHCI